MGRCAKEITLGNASKNRAEWLGLVACLRHAQMTSSRTFMFQLDSFLVTKQINGIWSCKHPELRDFFEEAWELKCRLTTRGKRVRFFHIFRGFNTLADSLANEVLDRQIAIAEDWPCALP